MSPRFRKLLIALALLVVCRCSAYNWTDHGVDRRPAGLQLNVLDVRRTAEGVQLQLELRNDSQEPFRYLAWGREAPVFRYQYLTGAVWRRGIETFCGTGMQMFGTRPGDRVLFTANASAPNRLKRLRVGIVTDKGMLWTAVIDPALLKAGRVAGGER